MSLIDVVALSAEKCKYPIKAKLKYATKKNFVGRPISGYHEDAKDFALMTPSAAEQLCQVQQYLNETLGLGLYIYDSYRPKRAVQDFMFWSKQPPESEYELVRKEKHYPHIRKDQLFDLGYVAEDSGHCYGNTVDLVLIDIASGRKLPMGARYDYMDTLSHIDVDLPRISEEDLANRTILSEAMQKFGFEPYQNEFWHFSYQGKAGRETQEPMDVEMTAQCRGLK
ncbi:MAG: M15 family metallopeptidase [Gammaproteobacteria bacterium]|nr:M15 family metallopeptidase [Gammaproteobacteria bacterium]